MALAMMDTKTQYGIVSRVLHWGMALLFAWQFSGAVFRVFFEDTALEAFLWGTHRTVGVILMALILLRVVWALFSASRRPESVGVMAKLGHIALYALMLAVPGIALIRQYGSGRALDVFGVNLMSGGGERVDWMVNLGGLLHGELGWALLALIAGHIIMAFVHRRSPSQDVLSRMV
ncbi:cytochrome b [Vreelandella olivaria]|uniref:cytochrome b n=1 Tax=Vreelandella olivaria TaxID=390919 RepID=UPI00201F3571|nr:cytochrome b [Halomonas olivaria]